MRNARAEILRDVRQAYLELYYQEQAARIIARSRDLFEQLVDITRAHYASGRVSQQDVLQAQLELSRLDDRATRIDEQRDVQRATLSRWIGAYANQPLDMQFPQLPPVASLDELKAGLAQHPSIQAASARVQASRQRVKEAREQYKPGLNVGVEYRKRFGDNADGSDRPDQMAAMLTLDLPVFTDKRQDKHLSASQLQAEASVQQREQQLRELQRTLAGDYARWQRLGEQRQLYHDHLLREAADNAVAAVHAYQSGTTEFTSLVRARISELDIRLQDMRIRVDRAAARARLQYLLPDTGNPASADAGGRP
jgi:outer membrane protein TolC